MVVQRQSPSTKVDGTGGSPQSDGTFTPSSQSGYKAIGVISVWPTGTGSSGVAVYAYLENGVVHYRINNTRTSSATITVNVWILYQQQ